MFPNFLPVLYMNIVLYTVYFSDFSNHFVCLNPILSHNQPKNTSTYLYIVIEVEYII